MIYFLQRDNGDVKIGTTENYPQRLTALQNEYGPLVLLGWIEGDRSIESSLHNDFDVFRLDGEWFSYTQNIQSYMNEYCRVDEPPYPQGLDEMTSVRVTRRTQHALNTLAGMLDKGTTADDVIWEALSKRFPDEMKKIVELQKHAGSLKGNDK